MSSSAKADPGPWTRTAGARAIVLAALFMVYFAAGRAGLALAYIHRSASAVWPPTGLALAAFLFLGRGVWPAIAAGAFFVNLTTGGTIWASAMIAAGNTAEGWVGAALVDRFAEGRNAFARLRNVLRYALLAGIAATAVSASIGTLALRFSGQAAWADLGPIWLTWWLGDATGALVLAPAIVLVLVERAHPLPARKLGELLLLLSGLVITGTVVFHGLVPSPLLYLCVPFPLWAAFRFGRREAALSALVLSGLAISGTVRGYGPFVEPTVNESLLLLQLFMSGLSVMILAIAAVVAGAQRTESALRVARDELEATVASRTRSLSETVQALEHEVAQRSRAEHELRDSELRLRGLLDAVPDAIVVVDAGGTMIEASAQAEILFGYPRPELLGRPVELIVPVAARARHGQHRHDFAGDPKTRAMGAGLDLYAVRRDGIEFPVEISLSPVRTDEGLLVMAAVRDVTERKQVERRIRRLNADLERRVRERTAELTRSNEALKQFAYAASHDLKEPVRTMGNYAEIVARRYRGKIDADADEFLGFIVDGAEWMHQLLQGLLEYARVEMRPPMTVPTPMNHALDQALGNLGAAVSETSARITCEPLPSVVADDLQMVQLFQNLVGNAIKFRRPGVPPEVHVDATAGDGVWVFGVHDNGIGIDTRHTERIFAIFQRLHLRHEYPGAGVGLAICRKIVDLHGGRIWVEPRTEGGTTLRFTLPRPAAEPS